MPATPSSIDLESAQATSPQHLERLWHAWTGKAHRLLGQETRIDNLFWRTWHLERKQRQADMNRPYQYVHPPPPPTPLATHYPTTPYPSVAPAAAPSHFDRINEAGRQASRDLEAFLSNSLEAVQAPLAPNPPTFPPPVPPSPYSQLRHNLTNASPSPSVPHSHLIAPQPFRPTPPLLLPHQYQPSPEWGYNALPPTSVPPPGASSAGHNRIIATPSWTALISDANPPHLPPSSVPPIPAAIPQYFAPAPANPVAGPSSASEPAQPQQPPQFSPSAPLHPNPYAYLAQPLPISQPPHAAHVHTQPLASQPPSLPQQYYPSAPLPTPSFTLPPSATLFTDLPSALSSTPALQSAPLSFYSSYGSYQPIITPYPRFLTPSPEPSILGELELDLDLGDATGTTFDYESVIGATGATAEGSLEGDPNGGADDGEEGLQSVWREFSRNGSIGAEDSPASGSVASTSFDAPPPPRLESSRASTSAPTPNANGVRKDPFEGMSLAQIRSRANSLEAVDQDAARYEAFGAGSGLEPSDRAAFEVSRHASRDKGKGTDKDKNKIKRKNSRGGEGGGAGKKNKNQEVASPTPDTIDSTSPNPGVSEDASPNGDPSSSSTKTASTSAAVVSKKNRNPHATQLPGNNQRKQPKEEAGEGHQGPICSHCGSITTPLWRRGPDDELLCNACGLYLKLHSKPRPKTFGKGSAGTKRAMNGAAAKAAASGVPPVCSNCACTSTPMWRVLEGKLSCNACSLYYKLHKVPRPASLAQKRAAAAAAKVNLASDNPPSTASSPGDRPAALPSVPTGSSALHAPSQGTETGSSTTHTEEEVKMIVSPATSVAPLQPAVMPPPHPGLQHAPHVPQSLYAPVTWSTAATSTSPFQPALPLPGSDPNPFAQTSWGALAYQLVSAAAEEEAGQGSGGGPT
ncbi:uncharacterized protein JCM15063_001113 [Sporobolomyces koalae]|uniref:uncharacterized protein n=1 Tax=Sporobolomyces koalae TaxID=500713 RepID=UPI00317815A5